MPTAQADATTRNRPISSRRHREQPLRTAKQRVRRCAAPGLAHACSTHTDGPATLPTQAARAVKRPNEGDVKHSDTDCGELSKASLKCIEEHGYTRDPACQVHFDAYRECKKNATTARRIPR